MLYANLGVMPRKLLAFVMNKQVVLDVKTLVELFEMDDNASWNLAKDFPNFSRDKAIKLLFQDHPPTIAFRKVITFGLSI